ncbi:Prolyl 4-hydroxylase alpha subunit [Penicillium bovifimosum]|uniref:Prolyl 4-hydroxylase alpha subunit n=1 Tax=Penicillium bovifimosum TaxID=126998 RepID=A0A9W9H0D0_9EURO|nr:Prolyl 4-hydroxylase alpha subunit [Penicillium bovifimosum]KAJ5135296.1 Prolyl 4-hydroxylase alpha subunit [Penicillium bovifimosum]
MPSKSKKPITKTPQQVPKPQTPNWPPLRPLLPTTDLTLTPLLTSQIYLIRNFLPSALCKTYASFLASLPLTTTPGKPKKDEALRVNDRFQIDDARFAEMLWNTTALKHLVTTLGEHEYKPDAEDDEDSGIPPAVTEQARQLWGGQPLGLNPNIRIYRYSAGQFFGQHSRFRKWLQCQSAAELTIAKDDDANNVTLPPPNSRSKATPARTTWTLLVYLSSCTGGETIFYPEPTRENRNPEPIAVAPEVGMALLHRHGDHCMLHEGAEVTGGEKWVLRSDLVVPR